MGIKNFTTFISNNMKFREVKLTDFKALVIDGNNLCAKLYYQENIDWKMGGEYSEYYSKVKGFFKQILRAGVKPIVVLDGLHDEDKMSTILKRKEEKNADMLSSQKGSEGKSVSPLLMIQIFIDVLQELKIEVRVAAGEGDNEVAAVANSYCCPVLASDSDYFMFELYYGYIPLNTFNVSTGTCSLFHIDMFQKRFSLRDPKFRLLIPAIHGNDFLKNAVSGKYNFQDTLETAREYSSCKVYFDRKCTALARKNFQAAEKQYCNPKSPSDSEFKFLICCQDLPEWVVEAYKRGCFHPFLLDMRKHKMCVMSNIVEDIKRESAWICSRYIRQCLYGFMGLSNEIEEMIRKSSSTEIVVELILPTNLNPSVNIDDIFKKTVDERRYCVLEVLLNSHKLSEEFMAAFNQLEGKWKLPIAATVYWYHNSSDITEHLVKSLLLCFLHCSNVIKCPFPIPSFRRPELPFLHAFAQWQCVYHDVMALNCLVKEAFVTTSPSLLFSGKVAQFYAAHTSAYLDSIPSRGSAYYRLFELVTFFQKKPETLH